MHSVNLNVHLDKFSKNILKNLPGSFGLQIATHPEGNINTSTQIQIQIQTMSIQVRKVTDQDIHNKEFIDSAVRVIHKAYREPDVPTWTTESHLVSGARATPEQLIEDYKNSHNHNFVAEMVEEDGTKKVVGTIQIETGHEVSDSEVITHHDVITRRLKRSGVDRSVFGRTFLTIKRHRW
jgi:hypothetical protein